MTAREDWSGEQLMRESRGRTEIMSVQNSIDNNVLQLTTAVNSRRAGKALP